MTAQSPTSIEALPGPVDRRGAEPEAAAGPTGLVPGRATPAVRALCPTEGPAQRRRFAVLDGTAAGRILTDDPTAPGWAAVHERSDDGMLVLAGPRARAVGKPSPLRPGHIRTATEWPSVTKAHERAQVCFDQGPHQRPARSPATPFVRRVRDRDRKR